MKLESKVSVVDDDADLRRSLKWMLRKAGLNVETFYSAEDFLENYDPDVPGCVLLDLRMPGMSGLQLQERMIEQQWIAPVIIVSGYADVQTAVAVMQAGAVALVEKPFRREALLDLIHDTLEKDSKARRHRATRAELEARLATLTAREREVMVLIIDGKTTRQIGYHLGASPKTIEIDRGRVMKKMCVESVAQLAMLTGRYRLVSSVDDGD